MLGRSGRNLLPTSRAKSFFDPVRGEHRDVAFGLLKYSLPVDAVQSACGGSSRAWHFVWDQQFFRFAEAIRGSFSFDFDLYRSLDTASRRLFLLLHLSRGRK